MRFAMVKLLLIGMVATALFLTGLAIHNSMRAAMGKRRQQIELIVPDVRPGSSEVA